LIAIGAVALAAAAIITAAAAVFAALQAGKFGSAKRAVDAAAASADTARNVEDQARAKLLETCPAAEASAILAAPSPC
jgi:hypothetical protein